MTAFIKVIHLNARNGTCKDIPQTASWLGKYFENSFVIHFVIDGVESLHS